MVDFIIDNRTIKEFVPLADVAIKGDSLSQTLVFSIDRMFDAVDLSQKSIKVNYINAQNKSGSTEAEVVSVEDDTLIFKWQIESETLVESGKVQYGIEFYSVDGNTKYIWQTKPSSFTVENSLVILNDAVPTDYMRQISFYNNNDNDRQYLEIQDQNDIVQIDDRNILIGVIKDLVVSQDNLSQVISFKINRYHDGIDLASKKICINFINAENKSDQTSPINVKVNQLEIEFGWLLDSKVTAKDGNVLFSISFIGFIGDNEFYYKQTKPATFSVERGLFVDGAIDPPEPSWLQALNLDIIRLQTTKANGLLYEDSQLQLMADGNPIGEPIIIDSGNNDENMLASKFATNSKVNQGYVDKAIVADRIETLSENDIPTITMSKISDAGTSATRDVGIYSGNIVMVETNGKINESLLPSLSIDTSAEDIKFLDGETFQDKYNSGELKGDDGKSAYEIWLEHGNYGTEQDFLNSLKGASGTGGESGASGLTIIKFSLPVESWRISDTHENYIYEADIELHGVVEDDFVNVNFDVPSTVAANFAQILSSGDVSDDLVRIYAKKTPSDELIGECVVVKGVI